ncbi:MAG: hypothetical protein LKE52_02495 [Bacilli bacterium]|nr:hypothetical protein [Bacilli bacterium]
MNSKQRFLSYLKGQKKSIAFLSFSVLGFLLANLSQPLFVGLALDDALAGNQASFVRILSLSLAFSLLGGVLDFFFEYSVSRMTQEVIFGIRKDVFCKYNSVSIGFLFGKKDGDMLQLEIGDIENVANGLFSTFQIPGGRNPYDPYYDHPDFLPELDSGSFRHPPYSAQLLRQPFCRQVL